jgi:MoxR-like ATPase
MTDLGTFEATQFAAAVVYGGWAKIDEANAIDPDAIMALNSILAPPHQIVIHGHTYPVNPKFRLILSYNPGLIGTKPLPESLKDRLYPFKVEFPNEPMLKKMCKGNGIDIEHPEGKRLVKFAMAMNQARSVANTTRYDITLRDLKKAWSDVVDGNGAAVAIDLAILKGIDNQTERDSVRNVLADVSKVW